MAQTTVFVWEVRPEVAFGNLTTVYVNRIRAGVRHIANRRAPQIEEWMKANHAWQNITGAAEAGLHTTVEEMTVDMVNIWLDHGVSYGVFLELANAGRYAVISPAVDLWGVVIWQDVQRMMTGVMQRR